MLLFLLFLFPLSLVLFFLFTKEKKYFTVMYIGFFVALIVSAIEFIFSYPHRIVPNSFIQNYIYYFFKLTFFPIVLLPGFLLLISKDSIEFKLSSFFPLMASFYVIYLPYYIMSINESRYSGYDLFLKPIIYLVMLVQVSYFIKKLYISLQNKSKDKIKNIVLLVLYCLLPAFCDSCFIMNRFTFVSLILSFVAIGYSGYCYFIENKKIQIE